MEKGISILLFSDNKKMPGMSSDFLEKENTRFITTCVFSEEEFYLKFNSKNWDIILLKSDMPGQVELAIIQTVRLSCPFLPVIILASDCPVDFTAAALKRGLIDFYYLSTDELNKLPEKIESAFVLKKKISNCSSANDDLIRREKEINGILQNIQDAYLKTDINGYLVKVNRAGIVMFGYDSAEEIIGIQGSILYGVESDREYVFKLLKEKGLITDHIGKGKRKDGSEFWASMSIKIIHNENGELIGTEGMIRDISDRMKNLDELNLKAQLLDNSFDSILVFDPQGNIQYANENASKLRGYSKEELLNMNIEELIVPDFISMFNYRLIELKQKDEVRFELSHIRKDRSNFQVEVKLRNITFEGKNLILHSSVDITEKLKAVDAMIDIEARYRDLTESSPIGIMTTDLNGVIVYENPAMRRIIGIPEGKHSMAIGKNLAELPNIKDTSLVKLFHNVSKGFPIKDLDIPFESIYGHNSFLRVNGIPIRNNHGKITGNLLIIQDVTEIHQAGEALKESEEKFSSLSESSQDPIYLVDQDCQFLYANHSYLKRYDLSLDKMIGMNYCDFHNEEESVDFAKRIDYVVKTGRWIEYEHKSKLDNHFFIRTLSPIASIRKSKLVTIVSKDITDRKMAEETIMRERKLLRTLIENLPNAVFAKDLEYRKVIVNSKHIESVLGHLEHLGLNTDIDLIGKTDFEVFPKELAEEFFLEDQSVIRDGNSILNNLEFGATRKGEKVWNLVSKIPLRDSNGEIIGMVGITTDITELKIAEQKLYDQNEKLEKQNEKYASLNEEYKNLNVELRKSNEELLTARIKAEESDRLKTSFLQNMSHEIRTPMNAIMGFSELLPLEFDNKERLERFAGIIYQRSSDLLDIINGVLDISKIESGQLPVCIEKFELKPVFYEIENLFAEYRKRINKEQIVFSLCIQCENKSIELETDKVKLKQIFINLIGNALKFTEKGKIEAGCRFTDDQGLVFFVSDTGIGIPKEKQSLIFDRFMQINNKTASVTHGTGLGLSIVKGLIKLLGGKIWLESEPGVGSTFYFTIGNYEIPK
jgi:PAS domain S-box-containing protein